MAEKEKLKIEIELTGIDEAIKQTKQLVELLSEAQQIINSLSAVNVKCNYSID